MIIQVEHLVQLVGKERQLMGELVPFLNQYLPQYGIDSPQTTAHFLAQACVETDHFRTLQEYASGEEYEGREDLGNTEDGDGELFKGRGIFQTTGRSNYQALGVIRGDETFFLDNPEALLEPDNAAWSACEFWKKKGLGEIANYPDTDMVRFRGKQMEPIECISRKINGGLNGYDYRREYYFKLRQIFGA